MDKSQEIAVVILPFPCQSHLNRVLKLAALLSSRGLPVYYVGSATHNRQAKFRADGLDSNSIAKIHFHDFPVPPLDIPTVDPNEFDMGKIDPLNIIPSLIAYNGFRHPLSLFVQQLSEKARRVVLIYDRFISDAVEEAIEIPKVEYYAFNCSSAFHLFYIFWEAMGKPFDVDEEIVYRMPSVLQLFSDVFVNFLLSKTMKGRSGDICNTARLIDGKFIDLFAREEINENCKNQKQWALGPYLQTNFNSATKDKKKRHECLEWLDKQAPRSVIYVSFGTSITLSEKEARELAAGLEQSNQKFIWVVRGADRADIFSGDGTRKTQLPPGFEERVEGKGVVVRDWAPQLEILAHESTGGFMTHCGWNSCLESLTMGVPVAAWPMHTDQPLNAVLMTEILKVGLSVREWRKEEEVVEASVIKDVVERLMASEEGEETRRRAEEMSAAISKSIEDGGECCRDLESFVAHITR